MAPPMAEASAIRWVGQGRAGGALVGHEARGLDDLAQVIDPAVWNRASPSGVEVEGLSAGGVEAIRGSDASAVGPERARQARRR